MLQQVLTDDRLVTIRYATPKPVRAFGEHVRREPELARDAPTVLVRLLDAIIDRLADELENISADIEHLSSEVFQKNVDDRRIPADRLTRLLTVMLDEDEFLSPYGLRSMSCTKPGMPTRAATSRA